MASNIIQVLSVVSALLIIGDIRSGSACIKKFSNEKQWSKAMTDCMTKLSMTAETAPKYDDYLTTGFKDMGLAKCILKMMELLTEAGSLDRDGFFDVIEENAPKPMVNKLTEALTKCSESSGVLVVKSKGTDTPHANFYGCFLASTEKLC